MQGFVEFSEEKKITIKTKMGGEIPGTIKVTGKDYHIVKSDVGGKQYKTDHQGNALTEAEDDKDLPFTPDKKKTKPSTPGKYGDAYSTVRNLARKALDRQKIKAVDEEAESIEERSEQSRQNKTKKNVMDASRGARYRQTTGVEMQPSDTGHKTAQQMNKALGRQLRREEIESEIEELQFQLQESSDSHKVMVTVSDPNHTAVSQRKEQMMKHVIVRAGDKGDAQAKAEAFYKKKGYKVHGSEYHSLQPATSMKTEETDLEEGFRGNSKADEPYWEAQDHKQAAEKARKSGDHFSYHKFMSAHHDSMAHWSDNKGRSRVANQHMMKSDEHENYAQEIRKGAK